VVERILAKKFGFEHFYIRSKDRVTISSQLMRKLGNYRFVDDFKKEVKLIEFFAHRISY
jgi:hypothetical protein